MANSKKILTDNVQFTVPSTSDIDQAIAPEAMQARVTDIATALSTMHGGCTAQGQGQGFWVSDSGALIAEQVVVVTSDCTRGEAQAKHGELEKLAKTKAREWGQESIRISSNGEGDFIGVSIDTTEVRQ